MYLEKVYELPPIDYWDKSLSLKKVYGMYAEDIKEEVNHWVFNHENDYPIELRCGIIGNPKSFSFEPVVYAKVSNNGTVYAFTNGTLEDFEQIKEDK